MFAGVSWPSRSCQSRAQVVPDSAGACVPAKSWLSQAPMFRCFSHPVQVSVLTIDTSVRVARLPPVPRQVRIEYPGAIYHVMNRGDQRDDIFRDDEDRKKFLSTLGEACHKT